VKNGLLDALIDRRGDPGERRLGGVFVAGGNGLAQCPEYLLRASFSNFVTGKSEFNPL
jgi:hypothetical protein